MEIIMRRIFTILFSILTVMFLSNNIMVQAADIELESDAIEIFEKDLITGEESTEVITVSNDENILNSEGYRPEEPMPNVIIDEDDTGEVIDMLLSVMPYSAIGRVQVTYTDGTSGSGTGFLFGPNDVATAAHVLCHKGSVAKEISFWIPGAGGPVTTYKGTKQAFPSEFKENDDGEYDWGVFHINSNIGNTKGYFGWVSNVTIGTVVQVIGYHNSKMMIAGERVTYVTDRLVKYKVDTLPGQSGGPVLNRALDNKIVAIHSAGSASEKINWGCRVTSQMSTVLNKYLRE